MNSQSHRYSAAHCALLAIALLAGGQGAAFAQETKPSKPFSFPATQPYLGEGDKYFYFEQAVAIPGIRVWRQGMRGNAWHFNTTQSVGDGIGMYIYAPPGDNPGWLCSMDTGVQAKKDKDGKVLYDDLKDYKGISLWIKGDGSDATAVFSTDYTSSKRKFRVPLKDTNWHKVFMAWDKWNEPVTEHFWLLTYGMERKDNTKANWYIVDRVRLYKEEKTESITPTPDNDLPGMLPAKSFVSGRDLIPKTLAKLKEKKPVKIVIAGDSIAYGAQLGYCIRKQGENFAQQYTYWWLLGDRLKEFYGYPSVGQTLHSATDKEATIWQDKPTTRPAADLYIVAVANGGWTSKKGLEHLDQVLNEKPDLVIWEYGANDATYQTLPGYTSATEAAIDKLREAGCEVILQTAPPSADIYPRKYYQGRTAFDKLVDVAQEGRRIARDKKVALIDEHKAMTARGVLCMGDLHADWIHINHMGHEMITDLLDALLTDRDVKIWREGPAAQKSQTASQPATK